MHWFTVVRWVWLMTLILLFVAIVGWRQTHHANVASGATKLKKHRTTKEYLNAARRIVDSIPNERVHLPADGVWHHQPAATPFPVNHQGREEGKPRVPTHEEAHGVVGEKKNGLKVGTHEEAHGLHEIPKVDHNVLADAKRAQADIKNPSNGKQQDTAGSTYDEIEGEFKLDEHDEKNYPTIAEWAGKERGIYKGVKWKLLHKEFPRVMLAENVLSKEERQTIIDAANKSLARSEVVHAPGTSGVNSVRTSFGMFLNWDDQKMAANMKIRNVVSSLMGINPINIEATQVLRYQPGQFYRPHPDYFAAGSEHLKRGGQRFATLLFWLNEVEGDGAETKFPDARGGAVSVKPMVGSGVMFYSMTKNGLVDPTSFHEGVPPTKGEKWVAVSWVRQHEFH